MTHEYPNAIDVLDHGQVRLVDHMGSDLSISRAARVSYAASWRAGEDEGSDHRLINYLVKNRHTTPLESVVFQFEVKAPIFVFRQWHRHRTWTYNELSARYRELPETYYVPEIEFIGVQSKDNKQMRIIPPGEVDPTAYEIQRIIDESCAASFREYRKLLELGCARELARIVLPFATYSHQFAKVDLHNLLGFLSLRCHSHAQYEIRVYALAMLELAKSIAPVAVAAWEAIHK